MTPSRLEPHHEWFSVMPMPCVLLIPTVREPPMPMVSDLPMPIDSPRETECDRPEFRSTLPAIQHRTFLLGLATQPFPERRAGVVIATTNAVPARRSAPPWR